MPFIGNVQEDFALKSQSLCFRWSLNPAGFFFFFYCKHDVECWAPPFFTACSCTCVSQSPRLDVLSGQEGQTGWTAQTNCSVLGGIFFQMRPSSHDLRLGALETCTWVACLHSADSSRESLSVLSSRAYLESYMWLHECVLGVFLEFLVEYNQQLSSQQCNNPAFAPSHTWTL